MTIVRSDHLAGNERGQTLLLKSKDFVACPSIVKGDLERLPGVAKVALSFEDDTATFISDAAKADVNLCTWEDPAAPNR